MELGLSAYRAVVDTDAGAVLHDVVIEYGEIITRPGPLQDYVVAAELYHTFLRRTEAAAAAAASTVAAAAAAAAAGGGRGNFDDGYIYGELCHLLLIKQARYHDDRLVFAMTGLARAMGVGAIEEYVELLSSHGETEMVKAVYVGSTASSTGEMALEGFFKTRGW
jgi:hypothetical protein